MATRPMKQISGLPGLEGNTYTFVQLDDTLTIAGKAADAKKTGDELNNLKSALFTSTGNEHLETTPTKYTNLSGEYAVLDQTNASMQGLVVSCSEGDAFTITTHGGGSGRAYGWLASDYKILYTTGTYANFENEVIVAPENAAYLAVNSYNFVPTIYRGQFAVKKLDDIITALDIFNREEPLTLPESYYTFSGKILNPDGVAVNNASYATTDYIYLPNGDNRFSGKAFPNNTYNTLVFYDDKREKVGAVKGNYDFIVSESYPTAKYFRASIDVGIGVYTVTISSKSGIKSNIANNYGNIYSHLHFTGKILKAANGFTRADTTDTNIINSDFIPIEEFISAEMIGSPASDCITAAFFSDANDASFLQAYNGDTAKPLVSGWYQQTITPDMVANAKYVVLQANSDAILIDKATPLYVAVKDQLVSFESNSIKKIYNVKDYGAVGDGITDDTAAIQSAIDDCYNHGGGEVYFPSATYALDTVSTRNDVTAHLFIPMENVLEKRRTIRLTGETSVMYPSFYIQFGGYAAHKPGFIGSTLKSTYIPSDSVISDPIAVIASAPATNFTGCNFTRLQIEHLNIATSIDSTENYPKVSGINASNIASVSIKDVTVGTDSKCTTLVAPPDGHVSYGIGMPKRLCDPNQLVEEVCIAGGYKYGLISTEHVNGSNVQIQNTIYAFAFAQTDHPNYFSLCSAHGCKYQVAALGEGFGSYWYGNSGIRFALLDFEENVDQNPTAFNYTAGVYDPHNRLHGSLNYFMVKSGVGATNADWAVVGAESLNITSENT